MLQTRAPVCSALLCLTACGGKITDDALLGIDGGTMCTIGPLLDETPSPNLPSCHTSQDIFFATPYTPPNDIVVDRIEVHMTQGDVALLTSVGGMPTSVLFSGSVGAGAQPGWLGTDVNQVVLHAGALYYVGFHGDCSWTTAPRGPVEYTAHSFDGPWTTSGTNPWTARLIGTCR